MSFSLVNLFSCSHRRNFGAIPLCCCVFILRAKARYFNFLCSLCCDMIISKEIKTFIKTCNVNVHFLGKVVEPSFCSTSTPKDIHPAQLLLAMEYWGLDQSKGPL